MARTGHQASNGAALPPAGGRGAFRAVARSVLLGAAVFALATLTGALLSGAAPAMSATGAGPAGAPAPPADPSYAAQDATFGQSMILSGAAALTVSVAGLVIVGRRRRLW